MGAYLRVEIVTEHLAFPPWKKWVGRYIHDYFWYFLNWRISHKPWLSIQMYIYIFFGWLGVALWLRKPPFHTIEYYFALLTFPPCKPRSTIDLSPAKLNTSPGYYTDYPCCHQKCNHQILVLSEDNKGGCQQQNWVDMIKFSDNSLFWLVWLLPNIPNYVHTLYIYIQYKLMHDRCVIHTYLIHYVYILYIIYKYIYIYKLIYCR